MSNSVGLAWHALESVLTHLLGNAYNILVKYLNDNDLNRDDTAEFWLCTAIDGLLRADPMHCWKPLDAMDRYITDVICLSRFIYRHTGTPWSDMDIEREIFLLWQREFHDLLDTWEIDPPDLCSPPIVQPVKPEWETDGIILWHVRGYSP